MLTLVPLQIKHFKIEQILVYSSELELDTKQLNEIRMNRLAIRTIVKDILNTVKEKKEGSVYLPEDINDEIYYTVFDYDFSIDLDIKVSKEVSNYYIDFEFYRDSDEIYIVILLPNNKNKDYLSDIYHDLIEGVRHELEHVRQYVDGYEFSDEPEDHEQYYLQPHEIEALKSGFKHRANKENKSFESVVRKWFESNTHRFKLNNKQIENIINTIIS